LDNNNLLHVVEQFPCLSVMVIGEAMLDLYLDGTTDRLCREAPVPVVTITERRHAPGGAANTSVNVQSLGGQAVFISIVGDDQEGRWLLKALDEAGVITENVFVHPTRHTLAKHRLMAGSQMVVRFDQGDTGPVDLDTETVLIQRIEAFFPECDAVVISDYGYGVLTPRIIETLARLQAADPHIILADSKNLSRLEPIGVTAVKPNYAEAVRLLGLEKAGQHQARVDQILAAGPRILELTGAQIAAVTLDQDGALVFERACEEDPGEAQSTIEPYRTYSRPQPHSKAAGAGDTFVSALTLALAAGASTPAAAELAAAAAVVVVSKDGTAACSTDELRAYFYEGQKHINDAFALAARLQAYRREGRRIVFTNGCFDILHRGHVTYLSNAKALGDVLIVGVNSDDSVRRLKGSSRPINSLEDRVQVLSALSCIDHIVSFEADTPKDLIKAIQPDIYVKGGDYTRNTLLETPAVEAMGGQVVILPYLDDRSTSGIIERIRKVVAWPEVNPGSHTSGSGAGVPHPAAGAEKGQKER
jgi:D-beta-D-heptose 7-phosphate kinase / D-beta-D-heptose 1-phosphate adenosyltransferase